MKGIVPTPDYKFTITAKVTFYEIGNNFFVMDVNSIIKEVYLNM